jgi:hypothetical protein
MSQCLERLSLGDSLAFKGPRGRLAYKPNMKKAIGAHAQMPLLLSMPAARLCMQP